MSDLRLPYTKEELLNLLGNIKNEEELREFIQQNSASAGGGHTDEEIRIIVAEWYQANKDAQLTKEDVDGWITEYLEENPVSGGLTEQQVNAIVEKYIQDNNISGGVSAEEIAQAVENYIVEHPITGVTTEDIQNAVNSYLLEHPVRDGQNGVSPTVEVTEIAGGHRVTITDADGPQVFDIMNGKDGEGGGGSVTDEQIASAVQAYLIENPVEGGMTAEQLNTAISDYLTANAVTNVDEDTFDNMADEWIENVKIAGANIPIVFLEGDTSGMSKDNAVPMKIKFVSQFKSFEETCTCKWQGTSSISYPKKNFTVKLDNKHGVGWGKQKKYCLKANYIDHSHARNIVSARLWSQVVSSRADYAEMPELLQASPNNGAIDGFPIRVYLNEVYQGLYTMNIPKGSWQFKMDDENENHCILCGENYASGCFRSLALVNNTDWSDELHDVVPESVVTRWNEIISFVMDSTDEEFKNNITNYIDLQSLIDYYIFAYVSTGLDSMGKNQIYYTYDGQKYYASMYDMDSTWGMYYNGQRFVSDTYRMQEDYETRVNGRQGNLLYYRLEELFRDEIEARYTELRNDVLSFRNILAEFEKFMSAITTEQYSDDTTIYSGIPSSTTNNIKQIRSYIPKRLSYVDSMIYKVNVDSIQLNYSSKVIYQNKSITLSVTLSPSNLNNYSLVWSADNENVTVENGKVTGIALGTSIVTVTDEITGNSASCTITVSEQPMDNGDGEVSAMAVYSLDEATEFNGTSDYIDTGVQLFDEDKDFTVFLEFENASDVNAIAYGHNVLNAQTEQVPYYGFVVRYQNGNIGICDASNYTSLGIDIADTSKRYLVITHTKGSSSMQIYNNNLIPSTISHNIGTHAQNVLLGAYYNGSEYGRYFKGTIHKCAIYDEVLSDSDIAILLSDVLDNITSISVEDKVVNLNATKPLSVTVEPTSNVKFKLKYETSDDTIVSIDQNGNVTGNSVGDATITVTDELTGNFGTAIVTVAELSYDADGLGASVQSNHIVYALDDETTTDGSQAIDTDYCVDYEDTSFTVMVDFSTSGSTGWSNLTKRPLDTGNYYLAFNSWNLALYKESSGIAITNFAIRYSTEAEGAISVSKGLVLLTHEAGSGIIKAVSYSSEGNGTNHGVISSHDYSVSGSSDTIQMSTGGYIGQFRNAKVWNTVLTEEEITSIYNEWRSLYS